ncbi:YoaK family protein [Pseudarthrobacter enclensis]|uniref:YoaK family protein n=1 Tax=Pseudarthrobacter enclensis TaxID=993070 RepID=UPI003676B007
MPARFFPADPARLHLVLMLMLTFSTGVIDAVGYLGLDRVFTANMTGNVVILGMALMGGDNLPVLGPIVALAGFMAGALVAGRTLRIIKSGWTHRTTGLLAGVGAVMAVVAVALLSGVTPRNNEPLTVAITGALAIAMGVQAATARHLNVKDVSTVVVTSTITGLAADSRLGAGTHPFWGRRLAAVGLIMAGAALGTVLLQIHIGLGVLMTALITLFVAAVGWNAVTRQEAVAPAPAAEPASQLTKGA